MYTKEKINEIMQQAQKMQQKIEKIKQDMRMTEITGQSGAGLVNVVMSGNYNCKYIKIDKEVWNEKNKTFLQDLITAAINDAVKKITKLQQEKLSLNSNLPDPYAI